MANRIEMMQKRASVGGRLKAVRAQERKSLHEFAAMANLHWRDYRRVEDGLGAIPAEALFALCEKLDLNPHWFMSGQGDMKKVELTEVAINVAHSLFDVITNENISVSSEEFEVALRHALEIGVSTGELTREDLPTIVSQIQQTILAEAGE